MTCTCCGALFQPTVCLDCVTTLDDTIHYAILEQLVDTMSEDAGQHHQFKRLLAAYARVVKQARGQGVTE